MPYAQLQPSKDLKDPQQTQQPTSYKHSEFQLVDTSKPACTTEAMSTEIKAANGAAVRFNPGDVTLHFDVKGTTITGTKGNTAPTIYIPITNPVSTSLEITNVKVDFLGGATSGSQTGAVTDMWVYFGDTYVWEAKVDWDWNYTSTFDAPIRKPYKVADAKSYGVLIALALSLPSTDTNITLYSVDVTFSPPPKT